jgi:hypothetical protein
VLSPTETGEITRFTREVLMASRIVVVHCGMGRMARPKPRQDQSAPLRGRDLQLAEGLAAHDAAAHAPAGVEARLTDSRERERIAEDRE